MYLFADTIKSACGLKKTKITKKNASISLVVGIAGISFLLALLGALIYYLNRDFNFMIPLWIIVALVAITNVCVNYSFYSKMGIFSQVIKESQDEKIKPIKESILKGYNEFSNNIPSSKKNKDLYKEYKSALIEFSKLDFSNSTSLCLVQKEFRKTIFARYLSLPLVFAYALMPLAVIIINHIN